MTVLSDQQATLAQGVETRLHRGRFEKVRVTLTGISGEFTTIPFKVNRRGGSAEFFEANEVFLRVFQTLFGAEILATTPAGVATLDIVFDVRTGSDA